MTRYAQCHTLGNWKHIYMALCSNYRDQWRPHFSLLSRTSAPRSNPGTTRNASRPGCQALSTGRWHQEVIRSRGRSPRDWNPAGFKGSCLHPTPQKDPWRAHHPSTADFPHCHGKGSNRSNLREVLPLLAHGFLGSV